MTAMNCEWCSGPMPKRVRKDARYCSGACRVAKHRAEKRAAESAASLDLPRRLTRRPQWVRRSANKVPLTVTGSAASSSDASTWSTFEAAAKSTAGDGLGFVLTGDGTICVDLDHCLTDGALSDDAAAFLATLPPTYIEISPSGGGLHVWGTGLVLASRKIRNSKLAGEVIGSRKYVTVTGQRWRNSPLMLANIAAQAGALIY